MKKQLAAFTIAECVLALLVTAMVALAASRGMHSAVKISHQNLREPAAWYHFLLEMESPKRQLVLRKVTHIGVDEIELTSRLNHKDYVLACSNHFIIYLRGPHHGYLPLYGPVARGGFHYRQLDSQRVLVEVINYEGQTHRAVLCFARPEHQNKGH